MFLLLLPVFLVSATESVGDLTATAAAGGWLLAGVASRAELAGAGLLFLQFPVSNGAFLAMALELALPRPRLAAGAE